MDEFNMIEEQQSEVAYQSEVMTSVNATAVDNCELTYSQQQEQQQQQQDQLFTEDAEFSAPQEKTIADKVDEDEDEMAQADVVDGQSVSANVDDNPPNIVETNSNAQTETADDKCAMDSNESEHNVNATVTAAAVTSDETNDGNGDDEEKKMKEEEEAAEVSKSENNGDGGEMLVKNDRKNEDEIDTNQCRICMSTTNLLDIFRIGEKSSFRFCDLIMKLAPSVKISERDYLPHSICGGCVDRIEAAYELRIQCEETDKFLRSKLKRSKKTRRTPAEFVLIDCAESSSDSDDEQKSDDEFQLSEESEDESSESDSESSYDEKKKRIPSQRGRKRGPPPSRSNVVAYQSHSAKKSKNSGIVYIKAKKSEDDDDYGTSITTAPGPKSMKRLQSVKPVTNRLQFRCDVCNRTCTSAETLAQHRRTHADERCKICSLVFKQRSALLQHMQRHREDPERICQKCHRVFATKIECQRHFQTTHPGSTVSGAATLTCHKCKRYFPNKQQFETHKCINSDTRKSNETNLKRKNDTDTSVSGRDLFKSVAPLTTTYWSDSFSD
ncbi:zinc finger imprinted 3 [Contarinia nasturtii]|uniref:zinc finger imprinted 3 n=1 Tax=Contarinia nasturtii TaxID=265458 RepID=UPI0012D3FD98|nr:zinc finger imprinted 3 [Contarinia nasturtii]